MLSEYKNIENLQEYKKILNLKGKYIEQCIIDNNTTIPQDANYNMRTNIDNNGNIEYIFTPKNNNGNFKITVSKHGEIFKETLEIEGTKPYKITRYNCFQRYSDDQKVDITINDDGNKRIIKFHKKSQGEKTEDKEYIRIVKGVSGYDYLNKNFKERIANILSGLNYNIISDLLNNLDPDLSGFIGCQILSPIDFEYENDKINCVRFKNISIPVYDNKMKFQDIDTYRQCKQIFMDFISKQMELNEDRLPIDYANLLLYFETPQRKNILFFPNKNECRDKNKLVDSMIQKMEERNINFINVLIPSEIMNHTMLAIINRDGRMVIFDGAQSCNETDRITKYIINETFSGVPIMNKNMLQGEKSMTCSYFSSIAASILANYSDEQLKELFDTSYKLFDNKKLAHTSYVDFLKYTRNLEDYNRDFEIQVCDKILNFFYKMKQPSSQLEKQQIYLKLLSKEAQQLFQKSKGIEKYLN